MPNINFNVNLNLFDNPTPSCKANQEGSSTHFFICAAALLFVHASYFLFYNILWCKFINVRGNFCSRVSADCDYWSCLIVLFRLHYIAYRLCCNKFWLLFTAIHPITLWMGLTCLMERIVITFILDQEVIIGCGTLAFLTMAIGKYVITCTIWSTSYSLIVLKKICAWKYWFKTGVLGTKVSTFKCKMVVGWIQVWRVQIWWCDFYDVYPPWFAGK